MDADSCKAECTYDQGMEPIDQRVVAKNYMEASDGDLVVLLDPLKVTVDPTEIRGISDLIERVIFHTRLKGV